MMLLLVGLIIFLGIHSVRMLAEPWRANFIATRGEHTYKGFYSIVSLVGLVLLVIGYGQTRTDAVYLWYPPVGMAHVASLLVLAAFVLLAAAYLPGNRIKSAVGHPMVLAVKVWAFAHLLANGRLGDVILFGAFLAWAVANYISSRKRDRRNGVQYAASDSIATDALTAAVGVVAWVVFALWLHRALFGVSPFGG